ncbi:hypothetical protein [Candidatus Aquarickettsia rohweri]|nr:hypothetical protein [Candidatus Aquarickettsia rohweri]
MSRWGYFSVYKDLYLANSLKLTYSGIKIFAKDTKIKAYNCST